MASSPEPTAHREVQRFFRNLAIGLTVAALLSVVWRQGAASWSGRDAQWVWSWQLVGAAAGIVVAIGAYVAPSTVMPLYRVFTGMAQHAGLFMTRLLLAAVYYGIFTPVAAWFRIRGRDALDRRRASDQPSYWQPMRDHSGSRRYNRQF
jgi:hypothetical protein